MAANLHGSAGRALLCFIICITRLVDSREVQGRISGPNARPVPQEEQPKFSHMAGIIDLDNDVRCGGTFLSDSMILTAAHCAYLETPHAIEVFTVVGGTLEWDNLTTGVRSRVKRIMRPTEFNNSGSHDVAIWELVDSFRGVKEIVPALLPKPDEARLSDPPFKGKKLLASGWGRASTAPPDVPSPKLLFQISLTPTTDAECDRIQKEIKTFAKPGSLNTVGKFCCSDPGADTSGGDSGGPLVLQVKTAKGWDNTIVGVVAFGHKVNRGGESVNMDVSYYRTWILQAMISMRNEPTKCPPKEFWCQMKFIRNEENSLK